MYSYCLLCPGEWRWKGSEQGQQMSSLAIASFPLYRTRVGGIVSNFSIAIITSNTVCMAKNRFQNS